MMGMCLVCRLRTRINKVTTLCRPCTRNMQGVVEKYLDGDPELPLKVVAKNVAKSREAERWHFEAWPNHKNQQTCESVAEEWQGYIPQLYEGCKRIVELRALARQQAGETTKGDR